MTDEDKEFSAAFNGNEAKQAESTQDEMKPAEDAKEEGYTEAFGRMTEDK
jgi:hypothetical protein